MEKHSEREYEDKFNQLWEDSKKQHHADVNDRVYVYRKDFHKWKILMFILSWILPPLHKSLCQKRIAVKKQVSDILSDYIPPMRVELKHKLQYFNIWEQENSSPQRCASSSTVVSEDETGITLKGLASAMMLDLSNVPGYKTWFHPIKNPMTLIENPYPGYLDIRRARNYCDQLQLAFA